MEFPPFLFVLNKYMRRAALGQFKSSETWSISIGK